MFPNPEWGGLIEATGRGIKIFQEVCDGRMRYRWLRQIFGKTHFNFKESCASNYTYAQKVTGKKEIKLTIVLL